MTNYIDPDVMVEEVESKKVFDITTYKATKLVNEWLSIDDTNKVLPDPMIYNYTKKGFIPSNNKRLSLEDLQTWYKKYLLKNFKKETKAF